MAFAAPTAELSHIAPDVLLVGNVYMYHGFPASSAVKTRWYSGISEGRYIQACVQPQLGAPA